MAKKETINGGASTQNNSIDSKTSVLSGYSLSTSAQTIVSAINEILPKATGVGKIDSTSDGTGEKFNNYENNLASGNFSHAEGWRTTASGGFSHAEGSSTTAYGSSSHAEGNHTQAEGESSHSEGTYTIAHNTGSHAEGNSTEARGLWSHTEGISSIAYSESEHAEGSYNKSYESEDVSVRIIHSVGIGFFDTNRKNAHEIKFNGDHYIYGLGRYNGTNSADAQTLQEVINSKQETITPGTGLEFEGNTLNVTLDTTVFKVVSVLPDSPTQGDENKIHLVPAESTGTNNIYTEYAWVNSAWEILGEYTSEVDLTPYLKTVDAESTYLKITDAESEYATKTELAGKQDAGNYIEDIGSSADSNAYIRVSTPSENDWIALWGNNGITIDIPSPLAVGQPGHSYVTISTDPSRFRDDSLTTTSKYITGAINEISSKATGVGKIDSTSDGTGEIFNGYEGSYANVASGNYSHAEGSKNNASGNYSHAEGQGTTASGYFSHAEGGGTTASGHNSHAEGAYTQTFSEGEHAEGLFNKSYDSTDSPVRVIHSVGIGSADFYRKNAHEIKFNGDHYIYGVGGYDGTNPDTAQSLQTVLSNLGPNIIEVPELTDAYNIPANATMVEKIYMITIGATVYNVTGDSAIKWAGGVTPTTSANSILVVSVLNNLATWQTFI